MCCPQVLMTQVQARLKESANSVVAVAEDEISEKEALITETETNHTYHRMIVLFLVACLLDLCLLLPFVNFGASTSSTSNTNSTKVVFSTITNDTVVFESLLSSSLSSSSESKIWAEVFYVGWSLALTGYSLYILMQLRAAVRGRFGISTGCLGRAEDLVCVCCCHCCVLSQMARQTVDYETEPAACCTTNGLRTAKTLSICEIV